MADLILTLAQDADCMHDEAVRAMVEATIETLDGMLPGPSAPSECPFAEEKKDDSARAEQYRPTQVHLLVAGPKIMVGNSRGVDRPEWEKQWTYGETVFGDVVRKIGLEKFSPGAETQLVANLLDVKTTLGRTQEAALSASSVVNVNPLLDEVASLCRSTLHLRNCPPVNRATVVLPVSTEGLADKEARERKRAEAVKEAKVALGRRWEEDESGVLRDARVDFVVVEA